jgi:hypothetical protein
VESTADLPDPSAPADVEGAYFQDGSIYLVAENLPTEQRAHEVFRHEVFGHMAVERNERLHKVFRQVERSITVGGLQDLVREVRARQGLLDGLTEAREVVALMAERGTRNPLMRDLAAAVRAVGAELGLDMNLDEADLTRLVGVAARDLKRDVAIMHDFQAAAGTSAAQALNKAEPTDEEILAAIDAIYEGRGDQLDSRPKGRRVSDIQDFGDLALTEELQVEGEEGLVEVTQSAQRAFEQARDRVKHLERLRECLLGS